MTLKPYFSLLLIFLHVGSLVWFLCLDYSYLSEHKFMRILLFYVPSLILPAINNSLREDLDNKYQLLIYQAHNLFCLLIGTIYALYYSGLLFTARGKIISGCVLFLIIFITIFINLSRHGFLKNGRDKTR